VKPAPGSVPEPLSVVVLETEPVVKNLVAIRYTDGLTISLLLVDKKLVENSMTFALEWDYEVVKEEKKKGAGVRFENIGRKAVWKQVFHILELALSEKCSP
jgi:hypothetical protein